MRLSGISVLAVLLMGAVEVQAQSGTEVESHAVASTIAETHAVMLDVARAGSRIVAVGVQGAIVYSDDEGKTWQRAQSDATSTLNAVSFADDMRGVVVGHDSLILQTEDGGVSWQQVYFNPLSAEAEGGEYGDEYADDSADDTYAEDDSYEDYGDDYSDDYADDYSDDEGGAAASAGSPFMDVYFADSSRVYAIGAYGLFMQSQDGGASWEPYAGKINNPEGWHYYAISGNDSGQIIVAGEKGTLYYSADGADSFRNVASPYQGTFFGAMMGDSGAFWSYGLQGRVFYGKADSLVEVESHTEAGLQSAIRDLNGVYVVGNNGVILKGSSKAMDLYTLKNRSTINAAVQLQDGSLLVAGEYGLSVVSISR